MRSLLQRKDHITHGYTDNQGVRLHYASIGAGPLVICLHGFPDYWGTWLNLMKALAPHYQVVSMDMRGFNLSDKPANKEAYAMEPLVEDVETLIRHLGQKQAIIIGHDWGGWIGWEFAMRRPTLTQALIVLAIPHPYALKRELAFNDAQQKNSQYARDFQRPDAYKHLSHELLEALVESEMPVSWRENTPVRTAYQEALRRSSLESMLSYYQQNYPYPPYTYQEPSSPTLVEVPVLQFHGLDDQYLLASGSNNTWRWIARDWTLVTLPGIGHNIHHHAPELTAQAIQSWLTWHTTN